MGGAYAKNLAAAGWQVKGYDISAQAKRAATRAGIEIAADVATLAAGVPTIITSLPSPAALDATVAALTAAKLPPRVIIETSTFTLDDKERAERALSKAGHVVLDCPVSGTGSQAAVKDIAVYASGDTRAIGKCARCSRISHALPSTSAHSAMAAG